MTLINPMYWPDTVAFKRLVRDLARQSNYVPPWQEPTPPEVAAVASGDETPAGTAPTQQIRIGEWVLDSDDAGNLVARRDNGQVHLIALVDEGDQHG